MEVTRYADITLIGRFYEKVVGDASLRVWMENNWQLWLGYIPQFHIMGRGWIYFILHSMDDCIVLWENNWNWGPSILVL
jgi:hypothetical protein